MRVMSNSGNLGTAVTYLKVHVGNYSNNINNNNNNNNKVINNTLRKFLTVL
jgi:hypothetical protein